MTCDLSTCAVETLRRLTLAYILVECLNEYVIPVQMMVMSRLLNTHKPLLISKTYDFPTCSKFLKLIKTMTTL